MAINNSAFDLLDSAPVAAFGVDYQEFRHRVTGARHFHLASPDPHNAFMVAFPTLPTDSTGVAHILEHTTLCGSERYPVRDPFFMMLRRSLNTYMNAFTSGDATAYPFATQNHKDFANLLEVYLDAVFFPRLHALDFAQEGWRVERTADAALELHGVVYNEMKGAMSSPLSQLWQHVHTALFPDAVYHHNSGGEPLVIPDLTHAALRQFHARHYHPSNAVLMTYGDIPAAEHQARFETHALGRFSEVGEQLVAAPQPLFSQPRNCERPYAAEDDDPRQTHIVWGWIIGETTDPDAFLDAHFLAAVLLEHGASPLRYFLETTPLANAPSELCGIDDSTRQLVFVCGVEGSEREHGEPLERDILALLARIATESVEQVTLAAAVDRLELAQRDLGGGSYPFGLQLMSRIMPAAMYQARPRALLDLGPAIERLRDRVSRRGYFGDLLRRLLLDNPHRVRVVMAPDVDKAARDEAAEARRLASIAAAMDASALNALDDAAAALTARQEAIDDASILPCVTLADVPAAHPLQKAQASEHGEFMVEAYPCAANGVFRTRLAYQLPTLTAAELEVLPLWCEYVTEFGQGRESYLDVQARYALSGNFSVYAMTRPRLNDPTRMHAWVVVGGTGLARKRDDIIRTASEIVHATRFDELERLGELLAQSRAEAEISVTERGHQLAILAAARGLSDGAGLDELWDGVSAIRLINALANDAAPPDAPAALMAHFVSIQSKLAAAPRRAALIGEAPALTGADTVAASCDHRRAGEFVPFAPVFAPDAADGSAWITNSQVNFCATAYTAAPAGSPDGPALAVLGRYLQDGFLHREIREQGGAYGSGAGYDGDSATFRFFSYRDPRALETFADFDAALGWYADARDPQRLEESILGTIRALDQPRAPAGEAERAFVAGLCERSDEYRADFRRRVLAVSHDDLVTVGRRWLQPGRGSRGIIAGQRSEAALVDAGFVLGRL